MYSARVVLALIPILFLLIPETTIADPWSGHLKEVDGVLHVHNPGFPSSGRDTLVLEELWRMDDDTSEHVLGRVNRIATGPDGRTYLLDSQQEEVAVYDSDGSFLHTRGRKGEGPGEFRRSSDLAIMPDGTLHVPQLFPGRIVSFDALGEPLPSYPVPEISRDGPLILWNIEPVPQGLVMHRYQVLLDEEGGQIRTDLLECVGQRGEVVATYAERVKTLSPGDNVRREGIYGSYLSQWEVGPGGEVYVRPEGGSYEISCFRPDGSLDMVIHREYEPRQRRPRLVENLQAYYDSAFEGRNWRGNVGPIVYRVREVDQDIQLLAVRNDASCWILTSRGAYDAAPGVVGTFDVLDGSGRFVRQVTLLGQGDFWLDAYFISRDRLYVITNHGTIVPGFHRPGGGDRSPDDPREIICYRLPR